MGIKKLPGKTGKKASTEASEHRGREYRLGKTLLLILLVLDLGAGGTFAWLKLVKLNGLEGSRRNSERGVVRVRQQLYDLRATVRTINGKGLAPIDEPATLIMSIAARLDLREKVKAAPPVTKRWKDTNYFEVTVRVTFIQREGYVFGDLIRFLDAIEKKNPKLLIRSMNFGKRENPGIAMDDLGETDQWRPQGAALTVRTFKLASSPRP